MPVAHVWQGAQARVLVGFGVLARQPTPPEACSLQLAAEPPRASEHSRLGSTGELIASDPV